MTYIKQRIDYIAAKAKVEKIFKMGFVPKGKFFSYTGSSRLLTNCFGHAVCNFPEMFISKIVTSDDSFAVFDLMDHSHYDKNMIKKEFLERVKSFGLKVAPCKIDTSTSFNSWKVAMYFSKNNDDYHFLKEENSVENRNTWSHKLGTCNSEILDTPKKAFYINRLEGINFENDYNKISNISTAYQLCGYYLITNPNANVNDDKLLTKIEKEI